MSRTDDWSPRTLARTTGLLYLIVIICAGFAEGYVRSTLIVDGDAAATAANVLASEGVYRLGFAADLIAFLADAAISVLLYVLLLPAGRTLSLLAAVFRLMAHPAIAAVNLLNHFGVLLLLSGGSLDVFTAGELQALAMLSLENHEVGYLIGGAFFGVHLALLGWLVMRSALFPRVLGILLMAAAVGYLTESFVFFLAPAFESFGASLVLVTAAIGEVSFCLWLLIRGVRETGPPTT